MRDRVLLLGGTDVTLAVGRAVIEAGVRLSGVVHVGERFSVSYSQGPVTSSRAGDVGAWARDHDVPEIAFDGYDAVPASMIDAAGVCLVAGWYHMVPAAFRVRFPSGAIGLHASLLPRLRGGAPLNWAILSGLSESGVTLFELGDGVDDGPVYDQERFPIGPQTTATELVRVSADLCADLVRRRLPGILAGTAAPRPQEGPPSYGLQRRPSDSRIDWRADAADIDRLVRASTRPYPGAFTTFEGAEVRIWAAEPASEAPEVLGAPGQIARLGGEVFAVTGAGLLRILEATGENGDVLDKLRRSGQKRFDD